MVSECEVGDNEMKPTTAMSEKEFQDSEIPDGQRQERFTCHSEGEARRIARTLNFIPNPCDVSLRSTCQNVKCRLDYPTETFNKSSICKINKTIINAK